MGVAVGGPFVGGANVAAYLGVVVPADGRGCQVWGGFLDDGIYDVHDGKRTMEVMDIPVQAHLNAHGRKVGEKFYAPDDDKTWRLVGVGIWSMIDDPAWWDDPETSTVVDSPDVTRETDNGGR